MSSDPVDGPLVPTSADETGEGDGTVTPHLFIDTPAGDQHQFVSAGGVIGFGRNASNQIVLVGPDRREIMHLNNFVGWFEWDLRQGWQVHNPLLDGRRHPIVISSPGQSITSEPGTAAPLPTAGRIAVGPEIDGRRYTFTFRAEPLPSTRTEPNRLGGNTLEVHLSDRVRDYLCLLAEPELRASPSRPRRSVVDVAALWEVQPQAVYAALHRARDIMVATGHLDLAPDVMDPELIARAAARASLITADELDWIDPDGERNSLASRSPEAPEG